MKRLLSGRQVALALDRLCKAVISQLPPDPRIAIIGMRTRGLTLAERLVKRLRAERPELRVDQGVLDITFYRDDLARQRGAPVVRATEIDFDLDDAWVLLVDDVLQTGRSVRAALDALMDLGRPRVVRLPSWSTAATANCLLPRTLSASISAPRTPPESKSS